MPSLAALNVAVFTQPGQIASQIYLIEYIQPFLKNKLYRYVSYSFSPFGKTELDSESGAATCVYGRNECRVELLQYCAYMKMSPRTSIAFLICIQSHMEQLDLWGYQCAAETYQDWRAIKECVKNEETTFKKMFVERFRFFPGQIEQYPAIYIDNKLCPGDCQDLMQRICILYGAKKPQPCKEVLMGTDPEQSTTPAPVEKSQESSTNTQSTDSYDPLSIDLTVKKKVFTGNVPPEFKIPLTIFTDFVSAGSQTLFDNVVDAVYNVKQYAPWFDVRVAPTMSSNINILSNKEVMCAPSDKICLYYLYGMCISELATNMEAKLKLLSCVLKKDTNDGNNVRSCDKVNISIKHFNLCVNHQIHNNIYTKYHDFSLLYYHEEDGDVLPFVIVGNVVCKAPCDNIADLLPDIYALRKALYEADVSPTRYERNKKTQLSIISASSFESFDTEVLSGSIKIEYVENMYITKDADLILEGKLPKNRYKRIPSVFATKKTKKSKSSVVRGKGTSYLSKLQTKTVSTGALNVKPDIDKEAAKEIVKQSEFFDMSAVTRSRKKKSGTVDINAEFDRLKELGNLDVNGKKSKYASTAQAVDDTITLKNGQEITDINQYMKMRADGNITDPASLIQKSIDEQNKVSQMLKNEKLDKIKSNMDALEQFETPDSNGDNQDYSDESLASGLNQPKKSKQTPFDKNEDENKDDNNEITKPNSSSHSKLSLIDDDDDDEKATSIISNKNQKSSSNTLSENNKLNEDKPTSKRNSIKASALNANDDDDDDDEKATNIVSKKSHVSSVSNKSSTSKISISNSDDDDDEKATTVITTKSNGATSISNKSSPSKISISNSDDDDDEKATTVISTKSNSATSISNKSITSNEKSTTESSSKNTRPTSKVSLLDDDEEEEKVTTVIATKSSNIASISNKINNNEKISTESSSKNTRPTSKVSLLDDEDDDEKATTVISTKSSNIAAISNKINNNEKSSTESSSKNTRPVSKVSLIDDDDDEKSSIESSSKNTRPISKVSLVDDDDEKSSIESSSKSANPVSKVSLVDDDDEKSTTESSSKNTRPVSKVSLVDDDDEKSSIESSSKSANPTSKVSLLDDDDDEKVTSESSSKSANPVSKASLVDDDDEKVATETSSKSANPTSKVSLVDDDDEKVTSESSSKSVNPTSKVSLVDDDDEKLPSKTDIPTKSSKLSLVDDDEKNTADDTLLGILGKSGNLRSSHEKQDGSLLDSASKTHSSDDNDELSILDIIQLQNSNVTAYSTSNTQSEDTLKSKQNSSDSDIPDEENVSVSLMNQIKNKSESEVEDFLHNEILSLTKVDESKRQELQYLLNNYKPFSTSIANSLNNLFLSFNYYSHSYDYTHVDYIQNIYHSTPISSKKPIYVTILFDIYSRNILTYMYQLTQLFKDSNQTDITIGLLPLQNINMNPLATQESHNYFEYHNNYTIAKSKGSINTDYLTYFFCAQSFIEDPLTKWAFTVCLMKKGLQSQLAVGSCLRLIELDIQVLDSCILANRTIERVKELIHIRNRVFYYSINDTYSSADELNPYMAIEGNVIPIESDQSLLSICRYISNPTLTYCGRSSLTIEGLSIDSIHPNNFQTQEFTSQTNHPRIDIYSDFSCIECSKFVGVILNLVMRKQNAENIMDIHLHSLHNYHINYVSLNNLTLLSSHISKDTICNNIGIDCYTTSLFSCVIEVFPDVFTYWPFYRCLASYHRFDYEYLEYCASHASINLDNIYKCIQTHRGEELILNEIKSVIQNKIIIHSLPTVYINNNKIRHLNEFYETLCSSFTTPPAWCAYLSIPINIQKCSSNK